MDTPPATVACSEHFRIEIRRYAVHGFRIVMDGPRRYFIDGVEVTLEEFSQAVAAEHEATD